MCSKEIFFLNDTVFHFITYFKVYIYLFYLEFFPVLITKAYVLNIFFNVFWLSPEYSPKEWNFWVLEE